MKPIWNKTLHIALTAVICFLLGTAAFAQQPKIASDLEGVEPSADVDVIVQFTHAPTALASRESFGPRRGDESATRPGESRRIQNQARATRELGS